MLIGRFKVPGPMASLVTFGPLQPAPDEVPQHDNRLVHWDAQVCCFNLLSTQNMR
jgi:hypothetical protein